MMATAMDIKAFLSLDNALVDVRVSDKADILRLLSVRAAKALGLPAEDILAVILKREQLGSTGTGGGIAIPHARMNGISKPFGVLARLSNGIDFEAIDGRPVDLVFLLLLPAAADKDQLSALASVARTLRSPKSMGGLRGARTGEELYRAMTVAADRKGAEV
jgi:PTS system nitrogen regulatory IIA component